VSLTAAAPGGRDAGRQTGRAAQGPADYVRIADTPLSQPRFPETVRQVVDLPGWDGTELHLEIVRPDPKVYPDLDDLPVILEASPYHDTIADRDGTRIFPDPIGLTGFFAPRGYAVAMLDLRGTGQSAGCLDHLGPNDALDLKHAVEWLANRPWSNGRVGMTGHSYVGSTPSVAARCARRGW
jgi:putative CocE/NonD family hydrolase